MKKKFLKKLLSFALATVMAIPSFVMPVQAAETDGALAPKYHYGFEESLKEAGGTITAEAKMQQMGTYSGSVSYGEARDGKGKAVNLGSYGLDLNIPDKMTEYTLSLWAKPNGDFAENQQAFFIGTNDPGEDWIGLGGSEHGGLKLWTRDVIGNTFGSHTISVDNVEYTAGSWQQYILSVKDGNASIYLNGELFGSGKLSATALTRESSDVFLGINYWPDQVFNGLMDDVKFYDVAVTAEQAAALYNAEKVEEEPEEEIQYEETVLLDFTFDDTETGFKGGQAVANPAGTIVTDGDRTALQLNGSSSNWLNVTKEDGSSLLGGIADVDGFEELVISYDIKTNKSDWSLFIAPNAAVTTYQNEKYIGAFINDSGSFQVERYYSNNEARPSFTGRSISANTWTHIEIRLTEDTTTYSINGGNPVTQTGRASLSRILGQNPILYIGKATWGNNGEYFNGSLDNYKIVLLQKPIPPVGSIDKEALKAAVAAEKEAALDKNNYTDGSWNAYEKALADAEALIPDDARTTQGEVNEAVAALAKAKAELQEYTTSLGEGYYLTVYSTTTRFYANASNVDQETRSVYMAVSDDGRNFEVLNNNGGVIFSKSTSGTLQITEPQVFKDAAGKFTVVARDYTASRGYHVFTSTDGVHYYDDTVVSQRPFVGESLKKSDFRLVFEGKNLLETDANITLGNAVELTEEEYTYIVNKLGTVKNDGLVAFEDVNVEVNGELTEDMLPKTVTATYTDGTSKEFPVDWTDALADVDLTKAGTYEITGDVVQTKYLNNLKELNGSKLPEDDPDNENLDFPSNYDPATRTVYYDETKFIEGMADPNIFWDEKTGYYYMTASYFPENGDKIDANDNTQQYDRVVLRKAKTLEGLQDRSKQVTIWKAGNQGYINNQGNQVSRGYRYIWAPEIHRVGDFWVIYFTESQSSNNVYGIYSHALVLDGNKDPYETALTSSSQASQWQDYQMDTSVSGGANSIGTSFCLDMTYFKDEVNGTSYVVWAGKPTLSYQGSSTDLYIATINPAQPWMLTSQQMQLTASDYGWERIRYCVNEGPTVLQHDGNVFMAYSVSGTGSEYAIGMLSAKAGENLLQKSNWTKSPYPFLTSRDVDGEEGPGHNSFTVDQDGNVIFVYHARPTTHNHQMCGWNGTSSSYNGDPLNDPCRHARLKRVHWAFDGTPILKMTYADELLEENQTVTLTVKVKGNETEPVVLPYTDLEEGAWYYDAVSYAFVEGIMTGKNETTFAPADTMTRAELATMLYRLAGKPGYTEEAAYPDLEEGAWYLDAVNWASENGIVTGYLNSGLFDPHGLVTREQTALMLYRYATKYAGEEVDATADLSAYEDAASISEYAEVAMKWAVGAGIITGRDGKLLAPQGTTLRVEGANIIYKYMN